MKAKKDKKLCKTAQQTLKALLKSQRKALDSVSDIDELTDLSESITDTVNVILDTFYPKR